MPSWHLTKEIAHLARATQLIAEGEERTLRQRTLIEDLRARGVSSLDGDRLLAMLQQTLAIWQAHRCLVEDTIARLDRALPSG